MVTIPVWTSQWKCCSIANDVLIDDSGNSEMNKKYILLHEIKIVCLYCFHYCLWAFLHFQSGKVMDFHSSLFIFPISIIVTYLTNWEKLDSAKIYFLIIWNRYLNIIMVKFSGRVAKQVEIRPWRLFYL